METVALKKLTLGQLFHICWFVFFFLLCIVMCGYVEHIWFCLLMSAVLFLTVLFLVSKYRNLINGVSTKLFRQIFIGILLLMLLGMLLAGRAMLLTPSGDSGTIWFSVADVVENGSISKAIDGYTPCAGQTHTSNHDYFLVYPNSRFMVQFLLPYARFLDLLGIDLRGKTAVMCGAALNGALMVLGVAFAALAARKEKGNAAALLMLLGGALFLPYYLNIFKVYSDTLSVPFVGLAIWLYVEAEHAEKRSGLLQFLSGTAASVGALIKGNVWVLVVAALICIALKKKNWKLRVKEILCMLLAVVMVSQLWAFRSERLPWLDTTESDRYEMPLMHWVMMSSRGHGGFDQNDLNYSLSLESVDARKEAAKEHYFGRVRQAGVGGYAAFLLKKVSTTFSDGLYVQENHLAFFADRKIGALVSPTEPGFVIVKTYTSVTLCFVYLAILASAFLNARRRYSVELLFHVCMFGLILFFALWEAKPRYLLNFTPMFLLMTSLALDDLAARIENRSRSVKKDIAKEA